MDLLQAMQERHSVRSYSSGSVKYFSQNSLQGLA